MKQRRYFRLCGTLRQGSFEPKVNLQQEMNYKVHLFSVTSRGLNFTLEPFSPIYQITKIRAIYSQMSFISCPHSERHGVGKAEIRTIPNAITVRRSREEIGCQANCMYVPDPLYLPI
jgi:hypothetical protein